MAKDKTASQTDGQTRRDFLTGTAAVAGAAGLASLAGGDAEAARKLQRGGGPTGFGGKRPNILVILVDELRVPPPYEDADPDLVAWRQSNLLAQEMLRDSGMEFIRHYTASTACAAARTTLQTGLYPSLHGVSQVDGAAKTAADPDMFWLDPDTAPTMGDYFRTAGYQTHYRGKWHVSNADILIPGTQSPLASFDQTTGARDLEREGLYMAADRLDPYGYSGWVGPEPHGRNPHDSGSSAVVDTSQPGALSGRDTAYAEQTVELLQELDGRPRGDQPWLIVSSFVNPHDIALFGFFTVVAPNSGFDFTVDDDVPDIPRPPLDNLWAKPRAQRSYRRAYSLAFQPTFDTEHYRRFYNQVQRNVDQNMQMVLNALMDSRFYEDTIVFFCADHGELLGSHNGLHQKWYVAYEEAIHVPLIVHSPKLFSGRQAVEMPTSHVDLLPTLLGIAGIDPEEARLELEASHTEAQPLVGRDLSPLFFGEQPEGANDPVFFMTDDEPTEGTNTNNWIGLNPVVVNQPHHVLAVVATINTDEGPNLFKYTRYFDNTQFMEGGDAGQRVPDEFEMYNLDKDPNELRNLVHSPWPKIRQIRATLDQILMEQCEEKRIPSQTGQENGLPVGYETCQDIWADR